MNLRDAAQQALAFCEFLWREAVLNDYAEEKREATELALRAALAEPQPQPQPVAWRPSRWRDKPQGCWGWLWGAPTEADIEHEQKHGSGIDYAYAHLAPATPPQRQPLSDERIILIYETPELAGTKFANGAEKAIAIFRAAEKAHGIGGAT